MSGKKVKWTENLYVQYVKDADGRLRAKLQLPYGTAAESVQLSTSCGARVMTFDIERPPAGWLCNSDGTVSVPFTAQAYPGRLDLQQATQPASSSAAYEPATVRCITIISNSNHITC